MAEGRKARSEGRDADSLSAFAAADAIMHVPPTALEVARAQASLGRLVEARATLRRILATPVEAHEPEPFVAARGAAARLQDELAQRTPAVILHFSDPELGRISQLRVDGAAVTREAGGEIVLDPGVHRIVAMAGGRRAEVEVQIGEGETRPAFLSFGAKADRKLAGVAASRSTGAGSMRTRLPARPHEASDTPLGVLVLGGASAVALVTGGTFLLVGRSQYQALADECAPDCTPAAVAVVERNLKIGNIGVAAGAAAAVGAIIWYVLTPNEPSLDQDLARARWNMGVVIDGRFAVARVGGGF